ncbi:MAG: hypothetical protein H6559_08590 [Lewinellaceae bacterium]|nr:hypothetical protein [Lewinellaceae bacterium]
MDIDLENYDLSMEDYQAIVEAAASKFNIATSTGLMHWLQPLILVTLVYPGKGHPE